MEQQIKKLTNENLSAKFKSQFEMVDYAIDLVNHLVKSGRPPRVKTEILNPAVVALEEISQGKDVFEDIIPVTVQEQVTYAFQAMREPEQESIKTEKPPEKKKRRII